MSTDSSQNNKRIAKNTLYLYIRMGIIMLVQLYTSRIVLNTLGVDDYGIYNVVGSVVVMFSFISGPLGTATQRFFNYELGRKNDGKLNLVFNLSLYCYLILAIMMFLIIEVGGVWYIENKMNLPESRLNAAMFAFQMSLISFIFQLIKTPFESLIVAHERMSFYAYTSILDVFLKLGNAYSLMWFGIDKLKLYSVNQLIISMIIVLTILLYCRKQFVNVRITKVWDKKVFTSLLSFSGWSLFGSVASMSANQGLNLLLNYFYGVAVNAAVGIANQVSAAVNQFVSNFQIAYRPQIVKYYAGDDYVSLRKLIINTSKYSYLLLFLLSCPIIFNIHFILKVWLGSVPQYAGEFVILNIIYMLLETLSAPMWMTVQATGKIRNYQLIISSIILLNIFLSFIFLSWGYSPLVVMEIKCILDIIYLIVRLVFMKNKVQLPIVDFVKQVLLQIIPITIVSCLVMFLLDSPEFNEIQYLGISAISFFALYIPLVFYVCVSKEDRNKLRHFIINKIQKNKTL